jgi:hypothetical protein
MGLPLTTRVSAAIAKWRRMEEKEFNFEQAKAERAKAKAEAKKHRGKERGGIEITREGLVRCCVCHCTEREPCTPPCSWSEPGLCSTCQEAIGALFTWADGAQRAYLSNLVIEFRRLTVKREREKRPAKSKKAAAGGAS